MNAENLTAENAESAERAQCITPARYERMIQDYDTARSLHALHEEIVNDASLMTDEKDLLCELIRERFCRLNQAANPNPKPSFRSV